MATAADLAELQPRGHELDLATKLAQANANKRK
jgi:hypothetical protein